ncbi:unnamed protein product [Parajaminaea phylloscopi]
MSDKANAVLANLANRRSVYALGKDSSKFLSNAELIRIVKEVVRQSPTTFNCQASRVVILLGKDHEDYWAKTVPEGMKADAVAEAQEKKSQRLPGFQGAAGTVLFFEDQATLRGLQARNALCAPRVPEWSAHASGIAQANVWTTLEAAGLGANLQHYGNLSNNALIKQYDLPEDWRLHAELVFGEPLGAPREKTYIADEERFRVFGGGDA